MVILHSKADEVVPFSDSAELVRNSGLPESALVVVGTKHAGLAKMIEAVEKAAAGASWAKAVMPDARPKNP